MLAQFNPLEKGEREAPELDLEKLGFFKSELDTLFPTLGFCKKKEAPLKEIIGALKSVYSDRIGFEFMDLGHPEIENGCRGGWSLSSPFNCRSRKNISFWNI